MSDKCKQAILLLSVFIIIMLGGCINGEAYYVKSGNKATKNQRYKSALEYYNYALKYNPQSAEAYFGKGRVWLLEKNFNYAIKATFMIMAIFGFFISVCIFKQSPGMDRKK